MKTKTLGRELISIIALQLPEVKEVKKMAPRRTPYILPTEPVKLANTMAFPRYWWGMISAAILVTITAVKPYENPYKALAKTIKE